MGVPAYPSARGLGDADPQPDATAVQGGSRQAGPGATSEGIGTIATKAGKPPGARKLLALVNASLDNDKADDVVVIDLKGKTSIADYMVIASGASQRQVGAMSEHLREKIKALGAAQVAVEGTQQCDWVLIDAGDVIVHLFRPEVRAFYALEKMWGTPALHRPAEPAATASLGA
jgi:ribosome-associated protein